MSILAANHDSSKSKLIPICSLVFDSFELRGVFFQIESNQQHGNGWKGGSAKDDEVKTGKKQYIFNSFKLVEEKFELEFALNLNRGFVIASGFLAEGMTST